MSYKVPGSTVKCPKETLLIANGKNRTKGLTFIPHKFSKLKFPVPLIITISFCLVSYAVLFEESIWTWGSWHPSGFSGLTPVIWMIPGQDLWPTWFLFPSRCYWLYLCPPTILYNKREGKIFWRLESARQMEVTFIIKSSLGIYTFTACSQGWK